MFWLVSSMPFLASLRVVMTIYTSALTDVRANSSTCLMKAPEHKLSLVPVLRP
jgi:hypothetical protein